MAWLGKFQNLSSNLGNFTDLAGAVNKLSESVKNIEKNFDSALGFDDKSKTDEAPTTTNEKMVSPTEPPVTAVITSNVGTENGNSQGEPSLLNMMKAGFAVTNLGTPEKVEELIPEQHAEESDPSKEHKKLEKEHEKLTIPAVTADTGSPRVEVKGSPQETQDEEESKVLTLTVESNHAGKQLEVSDQLESDSTEKVDETKKHDVDSPIDETAEKDHVEESISAEQKSYESHDANSTVPSSLSPLELEVKKADVTGSEAHLERAPPEDSPSDVSKVDATVASLEQSKDTNQLENSELLNRVALPQEKSFPTGESDVVASLVSERKEDGESKLRSELKMMEAALQGAARQAQMKADEISRLMAENEDLKLIVEELKKKSNDLELDALREEYQQRLGAAERKVYALTKERDMLRREQNRKSDSSLLLKEKDEIIKQVMAEGEELSKKQAVQEGTMKKLRAQIRELEEEKQRLTSRVQVEEGKVESIRKDKAVTEKALQDAVEKGQTELAALREYYTNALSEAKDAEAKAEARADSEAMAELERRCRESGDREVTLLQNLDELRQALSGTEQQAAFREDMLRKDLEDLEKRCQAAETRYDELVANMPDSTRPLLRQIEGLEEAAAMRAEVWAGVERSLNSRLQEAEVKAAGAQERERAINERLSQTLSRTAVMEAQLSCLRAEQSQLTRSLEKERQRASESRQEYLVAMERAVTQEGRAKQLEEEIQQLRLKHKQELKEERTRRLGLEQEIERERAVIGEYEKRLRAEGRTVAEKAAGSPMQLTPQSELSSNNKSHKRVPSISSAGSVEESFFLQTSMDSTIERTPVERLSFSERPQSPFTRVLGSSHDQLESQLRQKEGELSSCFARLAALESTRDSLAEELVKATTQSELLRADAVLLPGLRAELDSLRQRHTSALELMGERDEEVEELKADLADVKQMYREQITMLVGQIERLSTAIANRKS